MSTSSLPTKLTVGSGERRYPETRSGIDQALDNSLGFKVAGCDERPLSVEV